ncbi:MAG: addiction module protein [Candidatus Didemnitutus sp.]|nr:addiction module protein [Candidatus Didemnitutus sp.]
MNAALAAELERLSPAEKLLLVEELWNQIARDSNAVEPPAWHDDALAEDAQRYAADSSRGDTWENVKRRITSET